MTAQWKNVVNVKSVCESSLSTPVSVRTTSRRNTRPKNIATPYDAGYVLSSVVLVAATLTLLLFSHASGQSERTYRVGVFNFEPMIFFNESGQPDGFFIDVLEYIAKRSGWQLDFVSCAWTECLAMVDAGEIDLLPSVGYTTERDAVMDFTSEYLFVDWGVVYRPRGSTIDSIPDLDGKTIGALEGSIYLEGLQAHLEQFGITTEFRLFDESAKVAKALNNGEVDAGIFNNSASNLLLENYPAIEPTSILFSPTKLHFATADGQNADLLADLDQAIAALKADRNSSYYGYLDKWLAAREQPTALPAWLAGLMVAGLGVIVVLAALILMMRRQMRARTLVRIDDAEQHKQTEEELRVSHLRAEETLAELRQAQSQMMSQERMAAMGQMAGSIAHDFNNILVPIIGYAELGLMRSAPGSRIFNDLTQIRKAAERGAAMSRQILAFSRRQTMAQQDLDLNAVIRDSLEILGRLLRENIEVVTELEPQLEQVCGDKSQLEQVLVSMAVNARDAMPTGGTLTLATANVTLDADAAAAIGSLGPGRYALLTVADTGVGMTPEISAHIFEPFFTTKGRGASAGLGLATVQNVIQDHGGCITVNSQPNEGTVFRIYLPALSGSGAAALEDQTAAPMTAATAAYTILVAEDEALVRELICDSLRAQGYYVIAAENPEQGVRLAEACAGPVHLLLTDVLMPQMNGRQLFEQLLPMHPDMKVLYMSGYGDEVLVQQGDLGSRAEMLPKPFSVVELLAKVQKVLEES